MLGDVGIDLSSLFLMNGSHTVLNTTIYQRELLAQLGNLIIKNAQPLSIAHMYKGK